MLYFIGFSVQDNNDDVVEYKETISPQMTEEYAYNLWTHLSGGGFQGFVIIESYSGPFVSIPCMSPRFQFPDDWESKLI